MKRDHCSVLAVHPGAELFGSDRMFLESVNGLLSDGAEVTAALPEQGPLAEGPRAEGARIRIVPMLVVRKALLAPRCWARHPGSALRGLLPSWRLLAATTPERVYISTVIAPRWPILARLRRIRAVTHIYGAEASRRRSVSAMLYLPHLASQEVIVSGASCLRAVRRAIPVLASRCRIVLNGVAGLVDPSQLDESFGDATVEGVLASRPVNVRERSGLREAVEDYPTARVVPVDEVERIVRALTQVVEDWSHLIQQAAAGRERVLRRHAPEMYRDSVARAVLGSRHGGWEET